MGKDELDRYYTPIEVALACLAVTPLSDGDRLLEGQIGSGNFVTAAQMLYPNSEIERCDMDPDAPTDLHYVVKDFMEYIPDNDIAWVIGNPPYTHALEHATRSLHIAQVGVALLLRYSFLESLVRTDFWRGFGSCLYDIKILAPRPSFTADGKSDSSGYGWFVWIKGYTGVARITPSWNWKNDRNRLFGHPGDLGCPEGK